MDTAKSDNEQSDPDDPPEGKLHELAESRMADFNHPKALSEPISLIETLIEKGADPAEGIGQLCARAIANPGALIEPAGNFLAHLLKSGQLSKCPEVPVAFMVEELAHGVVIVSPLLVAKWDETGDSTHVVRLADGIAEKDGRLNGSDVGEFILQIALKLAILKPVRSQRLIDIARPLVEGGEKHPLIAKARHWRIAGLFLSRDGLSCRPFWQQHLKDEKSTDWESTEAADALRQLQNARDRGEEIPTAFIAAIPAAMWAPPQKEEPVEKPRDEQPPAHDDEPVQSPPSASKEKTIKPPAAIVTTPATVAGHPKRPGGFLPGFLIGGASMLAVAGWIWKDAILQKTEPPKAVVTNSAPQSKTEIAKSELPAAKPPPVQIPAIPASPPAPPPAAAKAPAPEPAVTVKKVAQVPPSPPQAPASVPEKAPASFVAAVMPTDSSRTSAAPEPQKESAPAQPTHPNDAWRKAEFTVLAGQHPALVRWHEAVRTSTWREVRDLVMGQKSYLAYADDEYSHLLTLLLLDPPRDPEVAEAVTKIAARRIKTGELLPLMEKLAYPGSPNEKQIRAAADAYLSATTDRLTPSAKERFIKVARPEGR